MPSSMRPTTGVWPMSAPLAKMSRSGLFSRMPAISVLQIWTYRGLVVHERGLVDEVEASAASRRLSVALRQGAPVVHGGVKRPLHRFLGAPKKAGRAPIRGR